jgi:STE24 endopeptidase
MRGILLAAALFSAAVVVGGQTPVTRVGAAPKASSAAPEGQAPAPAAAVTVDQSRQKAYSHGRYALHFLGDFWGIGILLAFLTTGLSAKLRDRARAVTRRRAGVVFLYVVLFTVATSLIDLPLDLYAGYFREKRFGFANQTLAQWMGDWGKGLGLGIVFGGLFAVAVYAVIRKFPRGYWVGISAVAILFVVFSLAVAPVFIAPLFNKFTPLPAGPLKTKLLELAHSQGIPAKDVYEVDASRQSGHTNAYVAGLLGTQRIVIYDTILKTDTPEEILTVMGHEMGHYVLDHIWKGIAFFSVLILAGAWLVKTLFERLANRHGDRWGFHEVSDVAGLPLILLILSVFSFLLTPAVNAFSRRQEHQADAFGLEVTRDPDAMASAFRKFNAIDLSEYDPPRFIEFWLYTHPSLQHRIEFCQRWKREHSS